MDHMARVFDLGELLILKYLQSLLLIRPFSVMAIFAVDDENGTFDAPEKFDRLR